jgi:hypothetical protein
MQQALQLQTIVDQGVVDALPALKPLLGHRVQMIALDIEPAVPVDAGAHIGIDDFLAHRLKRPADVPSISLDDMEKAIKEGALDGNL